MNKTSMELKRKSFVDERSRAFSFASDYIEMTGAEVFAAYTLGEE